MKLVYGPAGSGKSFYCMNEIKECIQNDIDNTLIYIVPEQYSLGAEFELSKVLQRSGTINIQVLSFKRLAYRVFNELGFTKSTFSEASKSMLIYYIMLEQEKSLKVLNGVNKNHGLVDTVCEMIAELKRYHITWEQLQGVDIKNEYLKMKLNDLALIYKLYDEKIDKDYIDTDSKLTILSKLISKSKMLRNAKIWIDEFDSFTPQEYEIIKELNNVANVTVAITLEKSPTNKNEFLSLRNEMFSFSKKTFDNISKIGNVEELYLDSPKRFSNDELIHLERNIYKYPYERFESDTNHIRINIYESPYQEIENIAKSIYTKVKDDGLRFENLAILTRNLDSYKRIFKRVFSKYNIPYFFDDKKDLAMQPLLTLIISLFDIINKNFQYDDVFYYLKTGLTNVQDLNDIDVIENYVLQYGIRGKRWYSEWEQPSESLEKINIIRELIINPILDFKNGLESKKTVKEITTKLYNFLISTGVYENIQNKANAIKEKPNVSSSDLEIANTYIQVWNIVMQLLDEIVACIGDEYISFDKFKNILIEGISIHQIGILPTSNDQVMIGDITRTRNSNVQVLYIIGMNDGVFPTPFSSEGFINDAERDLLLDNGLELAKNTKLLLKEENFNIYKALTTPSQELVLSYPLSNNEGGALRPSTVLNDIKKIFPKVEIVSHVMKDEDAILTKEQSFACLPQKMRSFCETNEMSSEWQNVYLWFKNNDLNNLRKVQSGLDYKNTVEYLDKAHSRKLYGSELYGSVSRLESYANCPFSYFLRYGLNVKDRKIYKLDTPDIGTFLHDILDSFSKYFLDKNISLRDVSEEEADKVVSQLVDELLGDFKNNILNSSNQMKMLSAKLKRVVKRMVWIIINHIKSGEFEVYGTEIEFGKSKQFSAVQIELSDGNKLVLSGVIDRMDIAKTEDGKFVRIIDYKSYNKDLKLSDIYYGLELQLLVYMDSVLENKTEDELFPGGTLYLKLDDPIITTKKKVTEAEIEEEIARRLRMKGVILSDARLLKAMDNTMTTESSVLEMSIKKDGSYTSKVPGVSLDQFQDLIKHMKKILKSMGEEILGGNIKNEPIKKKGQTACEFCKYKLICRFDKELGNQYRVVNDLKNEEVFEKISRTN